MSDTNFITLAEGTYKEKPCYFAGWKLTHENHLSEVSFFQSIEYDIIRDYEVPEEKAGEIYALFHEYITGNIKLEGLDAKVAPFVQKETVQKEIAGDIAGEQR